MDENTKNQDIESYENDDNLELSELDETQEEEEVQTNPSFNHHADDEFRSKMIRMFGIVFAILIVILVVGFIASLFTKKNYTYSEVESIMEEAAQNYFKDNKSKLPKNDTEIVEISTTILADHKYMKSLDKYIKNETCSGKVSVEKKESKNYSYTAELKCGDYVTTNFYQKLTNSENVVTDGFGLYFMNNEYVYRGTEVNNYVQFSDSDSLWRVVKVTNENEVVLISQDRTQDKFSWDERYNNQAEQTSGLNTFKNSMISNILKRLYNNTLNEESKYNYYDDNVHILTKKEKSKIVEFSSCVGLRSKDDTSRNGSSECSVLENVKYGLLPVYDFMNASLDTNCTSALKEDCQNYNYLSTDYGYWLANGEKEDSSKVYYADTSNYIKSCIASMENYVRVVIHLSPNVMLEKGKGTIKNPYIIR